MLYFWNVYKVVRTDVKSSLMIVVCLNFANPNWVGWKRSFMIFNLFDSPDELLLWHSSLYNSQLWRREDGT